jgi:hypothetical protein
MLKLALTSTLVAALACVACSDDGPQKSQASGGTTAAGTGGGAGATTGGIGGANGAAGGAMAGAGAGGGAGVGGGGAAGTAGAGGVTGGAAGMGGGAGSGSGGSVNNVPADYEGTPFKALQIPGKINAADYDRGGAGVAWCHDAGNCSAGTVTGDWYPPNSAPYRAPMPADAQVCSGAACDDNVGVCRMNPGKPDNTINGQPMPVDDTYLCYSVAGEWTKYTVTVAEAGSYAIAGVMAVPQGGGFEISFGDAITTGDVPLAITSTENSGSGENYHSWDDRKNLAAVTFPTAGTYLMTLTQVGRFNADSFTFTKM